MGKKKEITEVLEQLPEKLKYGIILSRGIVGWEVDCISINDTTGDIVVLEQLPADMLAISLSKAKAWLIKKYL